MNNSFPLTEHQFNENETPLITVFSWVFNHKDYIKESIDSILMQKTNFKVEIIIHDDASNDGTKEIVLEYQQRYPHLFKNILQDENQWSQRKSVMIPLFDKPRGKYIALTHGDDYWTDEFKLQKQVDFLEKNPDTILVAHRVDELHDEKRVSADWRWDEKRVYFSLVDYLYQLFFHTSSVVYRKIDLPNYLNDQQILHGDIALFSYVLSNGGMYYFEETMSVYRKHIGGVSNSALHKINSKEFESKKYIFENLNSITNYKYSKYITINFLIEKEIYLMKLKKSSYNINRFKYWFYKLNYKFLLLINK